MAKKISVVFQLLAALFRIWVRFLLFPITCLVNRNERRLFWRLYNHCYGCARKGVYPEVAISSLIDQSCQISISDVPSEYFNVNNLELLAVSAIVAQIQPHVTFEIGTADGRTTRNIARNMPEDGIIYTLNLENNNDPSHRQRSPVGYRFLNTPEESKIVQLFGDSQNFDYSEYLSRCNLVFVDADHSEKGVLADSKTALKIVDRDHGVILWHDALRFGVQLALPKFAKEYLLPIYLISDTNLALLVFENGSPLDLSNQTSLHRCFGFSERENEIIECANQD